MNKAVRKAVIAGNWKMNKTPAEAVVLLNEIAPLVKDAECDVVACVPYVDIAAAVEATKGTNVKIGAQNVHFEKKGAFTGEIAADMLVECGVEYVIVGHSERRQYFGETDTTVNLRTKAALDAGMKVILCLGEVLAERQAGITEEIVAMQTKLDLAGIPAEQIANVIIAYEPVWAIGTGLTATPEQAEEVCALIRATVAKLYGDAVAEAMTIQYGGSMNDANAAELLSKVNVDGGLIGGASLVPEKFAKIVDAAQA
jgi:triosephosphate isomerase